MATKPSPSVATGGFAMTSPAAFNATMPTEVGSTGRASGSAGWVTEQRTVGRGPTTMSLAVSSTGVTSVTATTGPFASAQRGITSPSTIASVSGAPESTSPLSGPASTRGGGGIGGAASSPQALAKRPPDRVRRSVETRTEVGFGTRR